VVSFGETVNWMPNEVVALENFSGWKRLHASNLSNMGEAFGQLGERLSRQNWCPTGQNGIEGVFVLFSDGLATDHYETGMEKLKKSPIFSNGIRLAVNFSEIYDEEVLLDFAGDRTRILNMKSNEIGKAEKKILSVIAE
jgi:hypothetical protein